MRRAQPSSSISAAAALAMSPTARTTERPSRARNGAPRLEASANSSRPRRQRRVAIARPRPAPALISPASVRGSDKRVLVEGDQLAERGGKARRLRGRERICAQGVLEPRDEDGETKRIEPGLHQWQIVGERREG